METISPHALNQYEGLVRSTAARYVGVMAGAAMDFEDIAQVLRLKVWDALQEFDPTIWDDRDGYVFMCIRNRAKDLVRRRQERLAREGPEAQDALHIEDVAPSVNGNGAVRDKFELRYLSAEDEQLFSDVLEEPPDIPDDLTSNERRVLVLLYNEYRQAEIAPILMLSPAQVKTAVKGIREKLAHLHPAAV